MTEPDNVSRLPRTVNPGWTSDRITLDHLSPGLRDLIETMVENQRMLLEFKSDYHAARARHFRKMAHVWGAVMWLLIVGLVGFAIIYTARMI